MPHRYGWQHPTFGDSDDSILACSGRQRAQCPAIPSRHNLENTIPSIAAGAASKTRLYKNSKNPNHSDVAT
jgi:hypothetical protein